MRTRIVWATLAFLALADKGSSIAQPQLTPGKSHFATLRLPEAETDIHIQCSSLMRNGHEEFRTLVFTFVGHSSHLVATYGLSYLRPPIKGAGIQPADPIRGLVIDPSRLFFTGHYSARGKSHTVLVFVGSTGLNGSPLFVVGFHDDGTPYKLLEFDVYNMYAFKQHDEDPPQIIGKRNLSEVVGGEAYNSDKKPYATTYDPYSVYVIKPNLPAQYSLEGSKLYNGQHYVWAGPKSREDYAVVWNLKGKPNPFGVQAKRLDAVLGTAAKK
jgi:hypothetical protein